MASKALIAGVLVLVLIVAAAAVISTQRGEEAQPTETAASPTPAQTTPKRETTPAETTTPERETPVEAPKQELVFVYGTTQPTATFDPAKARDETELMSVINTYDPLVYPSREGVKPWVAERWESNEDATEWTFYIRKGIKFHSGRELTAEDVAFSMERALAIKAGFSFLWIDIVDRVEVVDRYTVKFYLKEPYAEFPATLAVFFIVDKEEVLANIKDGPFGEYGDYGQEWLSQNDAGSGPYRVVKFERGKEIVFEKFDDYWAGWKPGAPDRVVVRVVGEQATLVSMLRRGEVDMVEQWLPADIFEQLKKEQGIVVQEDPTAQLFFVSMHNKKPPFDDVNVRLAVAHAVDYESIINFVFKGGVQAEGPVPLIAPGHCPVPKPTFDLEKAKEYLAKSKYKISPENPVTVEFVYVAGLQVEEQVGLILKQNLEKLGINVELRPEPWARIVELAKTPETTPHMVAIFHTLKFPSPDSHTYLMFHPNAHGTYISIMWYENPRVTELLDKARRTVDPEERYRLYCEVQKIVTEEAASLFIINPMHRIAYRDYVKGYEYVGILGFDLRFSNLDISAKYG
ncbi:MAG: ABC transporter substrate-binding protein [Desulfurococcales archaeon]|nr:ABC transporter substrate-binding protein [Desulfurococcales archaeon]